MTSWKDSSQKSYGTYIRKWETFCLVKRISMRNPSRFQVCAFIRTLSEEGYSSGAINCARCALSILLPRMPTGETMGAEYWVSRAVRAAWLVNPSGPKYNKFWNVGKVFKTVKEWGKNGELLLEYLVKKLLILLLLTTGQRGQVALALNIDSMEQQDDGTIVFVLTKFMKTAKTGDRLERLVLKPYHAEKRLCVVRTLREYLLRTQKMRHVVDENEVEHEYKELFLSYKSPHEPVSRDTISRWVVWVLKKSGVAVKFRAHSTRGAGVSAGASVGVPTNVLLKYGSWKSERTMAKHYCKEIQDDPHVDLGTVLLDKFGH